MIRVNVTLSFCVQINDSLFQSLRFEAARTYSSTVEACICPPSSYTTFGQYHPALKMPSVTILWGHLARKGKWQISSMYILAVFRKVKGGEWGHWRMWRRTFKGIKGHYITTTWCILLFARAISLMIQFINSWSKSNCFGDTIDSEQNLTRASPLLCCNSELWPKLEWEGNERRLEKAGKYFEDNKMKKAVEKVCRFVCTIWNTKKQPNLSQKHFWAVTESPQQTLQFLC